MLKYNKIISCITTASLILIGSQMINSQAMAKSILNNPNGESASNSGSFGVSSSGQAVSAGQEGWGVITGHVIWDNDKSKTINEKDEKIPDYEVVITSTDQEVIKKAQEKIEKDNTIKYFEVSDKEFKTIVKTDKEGKYSTNDIPVGNYDITVKTPDKGKLLEGSDTAIVESKKTTTDKDWFFYKENNTPNDDTNIEKDNDVNNEKQGDEDNTNTDDNIKENANTNSNTNIKENTNKNSDTPIKKENTTNNKNDSNTTGVSQTDAVSTADNKKDTIRNNSIEKETTSAPLKNETKETENSPLETLNNKGNMPNIENGKLDPISQGGKVDTGSPTTSIINKIRTIF